ncbi:MAG: hypothetical protein KDJ29_08785 [Hyphomicrobiales bacterium]|nr:hypothetical protein [Hyphomicrobiales bacterium]
MPILRAAAGVRVPGAIASGCDYSLRTSCEKVDAGFSRMTMLYSLLSGIDQFLSLQMDPFEGALIW